MNQLFFLFLYCNLLIVTINWLYYFITYYSTGVEAEGDSATNSAQDALQQAVQLNLENIATLLEIIAVLPVTSCEAERGFSRMKHIKNELRSTMTDQR